MYKKPIILLTAFAAILLTSLLGSCSGKRTEINLLPVLTEANQPAFINTSGEIVPLDLKGGMPSAVVNGYFTVPEADGLKVYKYSNGEMLPVEGLSGLKSAGFMACGVMPVSRTAGHIELVDGKGTVVASLEIPDGEITECMPLFVDNVLVVTTDKGLMGLVNTKGEFVVQPVYTSIGNIEDGKFIAMMETTTENGIKQQFQLVSTKGDVVYEFPDGIVPVSQNICSGKTVVKTASGFAVCDVSTGNILTTLPTEAKAITEFDHGLIVYRDGNGRKGLINQDGKELLAPVNTQIRIAADGKVAVCDTSGWFIVKENGEKTPVPGATMLSPVPEQAFAAGFHFVAQYPDGYYILNADGVRLNEIPLKRVDYAGLEASAKVRSGYPTATTHIELPLDEDWE